MKIDEIRKELDNYVHGYDYFKEKDRLKDMPHRDEFRNAVAETVKRIDARYGKDSNLEWPENLLFDLGTDMIAPIPQETLDGLMYVIDETLTDRESKIIKLRYIDGLDLVKTGKEFGVTRERIRQVEAKALRKMRHPSRMKIIKAGKSALDELAEARNKVSEATREYLEEVAELKRNTAAIRRVLDGSADPADMQTALEAAKGTDDWKTPLDDMGLSVRAYNCCKRAGYKTVGDFAGKTVRDFMMIRNLGRKSMQELIDKLLGYGIEISDEVER